GELPAAIEQYDEALRINPDYPQTHKNLGIALSQAGRIDDAIQHYKEALRIRPDYAEAHVELGSALASAGRVPEAMTEFAEALRSTEESGRRPSRIGQTGRVDRPFRAGLANQAGLR